MRTKITSVMVLVAIVFSGIFATSAQAAEMVPYENSSWNCSNPSVTKLTVGKLACAGNDAGPISEGASCYTKAGKPTTGCTIKTKACKSGFATANKVYSYWNSTRNYEGNKYPKATQFLSKKLNYSVEEINTQFNFIWTYKCEPVRKNFKGMETPRNTSFEKQVTRNEAIKLCKALMTTSASAAECSWGVQKKRDESNNVIKREVTLEDGTTVMRPVFERAFFFKKRFGEAPTIDTFGIFK